MTDVLILGATSIGLGWYCLRLQKEIRHLRGAGQFITELLVTSVKGDRTMSEAEVKREIGELALAHASRILEEKAK